MKILSTGDWHYGAGIDDDVDQSVRQIITIAAENQVDFCAFTGDMYERESQTKPRNLVKDRIMELADICTVGMVYGNHDAPGDLDILGALRAKHRILIYPSPFVLTFGKTNFYMVPWIYKANWASMNKSEDMQYSNEQISKQLLMWLRALKINNPNDHHIVVAHITVNGARAENNQPLIGEGVTIGEYDLQETGFDAGFFGHIHLRQTFANGNFYYNGSPSAMDFGETPDKYVSIYDTDRMVVEWFRLDSVYRFAITGEWKEGEWRPDNMVYTIDPEVWKKSRVKISYKISSKEDYKLSKKTLEELYKKYSPIELKLSPQVISEAVTRSKKVSVAKTYCDKLEAYWEDTNTRPSEEEAKGILVKLNRLEEQCKTTALF